MPSAAAGERKAPFLYSSADLEGHTRAIIAFSEDKQDASSDEKKLLPALRAVLFLRTVLAGDLAEGLSPAGKVCKLGLVKPLIDLLQRLADGPLSTSREISPAQRMKQRILCEGLWTLTNLAYGGSTDAVAAGGVTLCVRVIERCARELRRLFAAIATSDGFAAAEEFSLVLDEETKKQTRAKPIYLPCGRGEVDDDGYGGAPPEIWKAMGLVAPTTTTTTTTATAATPTASTVAVATPSAGAGSAGAESVSSAEAELDVAMEEEEEEHEEKVAAAAGTGVEARREPTSAESVLTLPAGIYFGKAPPLVQSCDCFLEGKLEGPDGHRHATHQEAMEANYERRGPLNTLAIADQAAFCLGNIAGEGAAYRDKFLQAGAPRSIASLLTNYFECLWIIHRRCREAGEARVLHPSASYMFIDNIAWACNSLARGTIADGPEEPRVNTSLLRPLYQPVATLLASRSATAVLDATWFFVYAVEAECFSVSGRRFNDIRDEWCNGALRRLLMTPVTALPQTLSTGYLGSIYETAHSRVPKGVLPAIPSTPACALGADGYTIMHRERFAALARTLKAHAHPETGAFLSFLLFGQKPGAAGHAPGGARGRDEDDHEADDDEAAEHNFIFAASAALMQPHAVIKALNGRYGDTLAKPLGEHEGGLNRLSNPFAEEPHAVVLVKPASSSGAAGADGAAATPISLDACPTVLDLLVAHINAAATSFRHRLSVVEDALDEPFLPPLKRSYVPSLSSPFVTAQWMTRAVNSLPASDFEGTRCYLRAGALDAVCRFAMSGGAAPKSPGAGMVGDVWWGLSNLDTCTGSPIPAAWAMASPYFRRFLAIMLCPEIAASLSSKKGSLVHSSWATAPRGRTMLREASIVLKNSLRWLDASALGSRFDDERLAAEASAFKRGAKGRGKLAGIAGAATAGASPYLPRASPELVSHNLADPLNRESASLRPFLYTLAGLFRREELVPGEEGERLLQPLAHDVNARPWAYWVMPYSAPRAVLCIVDAAASAGAPCIIRPVSLAALASAELLELAASADGASDDAEDACDPEAQAFVDTDAMWASDLVIGAESLSEAEGRPRSELEPTRRLRVGGADVPVLCGVSVPSSLTPLVALAQLQQARRGLVTSFDLRQTDIEARAGAVAQGAEEMTPLLPLVFAVCTGIANGLKGRAGIPNPVVAKGFERMQAYAAALVAREDLVNTGRLGAFPRAAPASGPPKSLGLDRWGGPKEMAPLKDDGGAEYDDDSEEEAEFDEDDGDDGYDDDDFE